MRRRPPRTPRTDTLCPNTTLFRALGHAHVTGFADWVIKTPLQPDSIFNLYSMSKPLAADAMLLLHEEGKWQLNDPVALHLPEFAGIAALPVSQATRCPTIRETCTHSAGFSFGKKPEELAASLQKINRKSGVQGKSVSVRVGQGGRRIIK